MRIIGGKFKGRKISPPANLDVRPTTDFAKEALFNILSHRLELEGAEVLELFAGTGNVTMEFLSYGASVTAVEKEARRAGFIRKMAADLEIESLVVLKADVRKFLQGIRKEYDIVFADPPYDLAWLTEIPEMIFKAKLLKPDGLLIVEHGPRTSLKEINGFSELRKYGNVNFSLFSNPNP